jgi:hypothetical protein
MDHPRPWLRYVDADDLDCSTDQLEFNGLDVIGADGQKLGKVAGFIVDAATGRPYYVVADAGGWFKSRLFLLPIGHVTFDREQKHLVADLTRERVHGFPGFDRDEFERLSDDDLNRMDEQIVAACCPSETVRKPLSRTRYDQWTHYKSPSWWDASFYSPDRAERTVRDVAGVTEQRAVAHDTGKKSIH